MPAAAKSCHIDTSNAHRKSHILANIVVIDAYLRPYIRTTDIILTQKNKES